jgi:molybdopterin converting factor small subunit
VKVRIPTPLRSYTGGASAVDADGVDVAALLTDLDRRYPGFRFRVVDEQGRLRPHVRVFVNGDLTRDLAAPLADGDEVTLMQALSGG